RAQTDTSRSEEVSTVSAMFHPSDGWAQTRATDFQAGLPQDDGLPPSAVRAQLDSAAGYAPPDPILPPPLSRTRPESSVFFHSSFLLFRQTIPLQSQPVAVRGFVDSDGLATGIVGQRIGSFALALQTGQVRGPQGYEPGFNFGIGYRFKDGSAVDFEWWYVVNVHYDAVATLVPPFQLLDQTLSNTFLFSPVVNFPQDFGGPPNRVTNVFGIVNGGPFGIWNAANLETLEYTQRVQEIGLN